MGDFGRYALVERLAVRPASEIFVVAVSGEHGFRRLIVLKRLRDDKQAATFIEDAKLSAKLSHARIVQTLELGRVGDAPYVATEYVEGIDLLGLLQELARTRKPLAPAIAVWIAQELLAALDYTHTFTDDDGRALPIIHGRLSPSKVLLGVNGEVKLCDYGVAKRFDLAQGEDFGHCSPEQVMELAVDARSDIFGVGVLLAEMLTRRRLFAAQNEFDVLLMVRDVRLDRFEPGKLDRELSTIVRKALEKKPEDRWESAAAFRDALDAWLFANRAQGMKQQLAALVAGARGEVDKARKAGARKTPEFDDLAAESAPIPVVKTASRHPTPVGVRIVTIPPTPPARTAARGTMEPDAEAALAAGTVRGAKGTDASPPLIKPDAIPEFVARKAEASSPVPAPIRGADSGRAAHPRVMPRGPIGLGVEDQLPARQAVTATPSRQLLTPEQLAKAGQPTPPQLAKLERAPNDGGDFERTSPLRVLFHLMRARATGLLAVTLESVRKDIYVRDGQLAGMWSNDAADLFGNFLVAQRLISEGELAMALATMSVYGGKLGDTLVGLGLLERMEVFRQLTRHARMKVIDICTWTTGRYAWYAGKEDPREAFPLEPDAFSMLGEAALALPVAVIDAWLARQRDTKLVVVRTQRIAPEAFAIPAAAEVFAWIDGTRTIGAIVDSHADRGRTARVLYLLTVCDLVRPA